MSATHEMSATQLGLRPASATALSCKICHGPAALFGVVDMHRPCEIPNGVRPPLSGVPIYYRRCATCGFLFTDAFDDWSIDQFKTHIYNDGYLAFDPDYAGKRPISCANMVAQFWAAHKSNTRVLDFGGVLRASGFLDAVTYDPMVPEHASRPDGKFDLVTCFETLEHAVFVPYAVRHLALSATSVGTTLAMYGAGMVVGALVATRVMRRLAFGTVIGLGPVCGFVAAGVMALTTVVAMPLLAGLSFFLLGVGPILWVISTTTLRQSVTPPRLLGRVSAINILSYGARPLGSAIGAIVGGLYGAETCLYLAVAIFGALAMVILLSPAVSLARQPEMIGDEAVPAC